MVSGIRWSPVTLVTLGALGLAACDGLDSPAARGDVRVTLQEADAIASASQSVSDAGAGDETAVRIDHDMIAALDLQVTGIQFLPANEGGGWISLALAEPVTLNLLSLPAEDESPLVLAAGSVPVGSYRKVRLFADEVTISFTDPITIGAAFTFQADTPYAVEIPSGDVTGLKTDVAFTVGADGDGNAQDVQLLFSPDDTFGNVTGTGNGRVKLAPVIKAKLSQP